MLDWRAQGFQVSADPMIPNPEHQPRAPSLCFVHGGKHCSAVLQVFLPTDPTVRRRRSLGEAGSHRQGFSPRSPLLNHHGSCDAVDLCSEVLGSTFCCHGSLSYDADKSVET